MADQRPERTDSLPFNGTLLSPAGIGGVNRSLVLRALCDYGPLSRADLARMAGVTRATIGNIVQDLIDVGMLEQLEAKQGTGLVGKPPKPVWFAPRAGLSGAAAIRQGSCEVALVNARGDVLEATELAFDPDATTASAAAEAVIAGLRQVLPEAIDEVIGIGIAVPGVVDTATGLIHGSGQLPGIAGTEFAEQLSRAFAPTVVVDNDARAQALGERWFGDGRGVNSFAAVQTGDGLGLGLVLDGVIVRGPQGLSGELGHIGVVAHGGEPCRCGLSGCWETIATLRWLRAEAAALGLPDAGHLDAASLSTMATERSDAAELLDRYADNLAVGLASLATIMAPRRIILHGDAIGGGEPFRASIETKVWARMLPHAVEVVEVTLSELDQRAGLLGAAGLVLSETFRLRAGAMGAGRGR